MALIFVCGFESFGTTPGSAPVGFNEKWAPVSVNQGNHTNDTIQAGRFDGMAFKPASNSATFNAMVTQLFTNTQDLVCGFAFYIEDLPAATRELMTFNSSSGAEVGVCVTSLGALKVYRLQPGGANDIESSSDGLVIADKWYYLEMKVHIANASGTYDVHLDGVQVVDGTADTQTTNAFADRIHLIGSSTSGSNTVAVLYDDFYVLDTTGSPSDFLDPRHVYTLFPTGAGDDAEFTPSAGNNYAAVDDNGHDSDSTYIESSVENAQDLYQFADLGAEVIDITGIMIYGIAKKTDITAFDYIAMAKSGGTEGESSRVLVDNSSYFAAGGAILVDPDTAAAWTIAGVNASQFGLKVGY